MEESTQIGIFKHPLFQKRWVKISLISLGAIIVLAIGAKALASFGIIDLPWERSTETVEPTEEKTDFSIPCPDKIIFSSDNKPTAVYGDRQEGIDGRSSDWAFANCTGMSQQETAPQPKEEKPTTTAVAKPTVTNTTSTSSPNEPASSDSQPAAQPETSVTTAAPTETAAVDTCGNSAGNGNEIVAGPSGPAGNDYDQAFRSLAVDPGNANTVILGTERNGFLKSTDGGSTWSRLRKGLQHTDAGYPEIWNLSISSSSTSTLLAATLDSPGPITEMGGIYKSTDGGSTWSRSNCGLSSSRITSILFVPGSSSNVVAGVEGGTSTKSDTLGQYFNGGMYYSSDGGANWSKASVPGSDTKNGYWNLFQRNGTFFTFGFNYYNASENVGFIKSTDNGKNWSEFGSELKSKLVTGFDVSADGQTIYANVRDSSEISKSTDGGGTWTTILNQAAGPVAISPADANLAIFASNQNLRRSTDGMANSTTVLESSKQFDDIVFAPSDNSVVYAVTKGYLIYKSTDSGATWALLKNLRSDVLNQ